MPDNNSTSTQTAGIRAGDGNLPPDRAALVERIKALATEYAERNHGTIFGRLDSLVWCQLTEALDQLAAVPAPPPPPPRQPMVRRPIDDSDFGWTG